MVFWTWAKRLEDNFDGARRKNLRHFIHVRHHGEDSDKITFNLRTSDVLPTAENQHDEKETEMEKEKADSLYYYVTEPEESSSNDEAQAEEKHELVRIPTCAIFHKLSKGRGVPHTFIGFIKQWPALPRVVVRVTYSSDEAPC
jgi:KUP system potassium uptake protein